MSLSHIRLSRLVVIAQAAVTALVFGVSVAAIVAYRLMREGAKLGRFAAVRWLMPYAHASLAGKLVQAAWKQFVRSLPAKLAREVFSALPLRVKICLALPAGLLVVVLCAVIVSTFVSFIQPASAARIYDIGQEYGDEQAYFCKHLDASKLKASDWPLICQSTDMLADALPPFSPVVQNYAGDKYDWGNCTYWAALRRAQNGHPVPNTWGDAYEWAYRAANDGYTVNHAPAKGAIMQRSWGLGHVAYIEDVYLNGDWRISEMNVIGFNQVDYRTLPASSVGNYYFIH